MSTLIAVGEALAWTHDWKRTFAVASNLPLHLTHTSYHIIAMTFSHHDTSALLSLRDTISKLAFLPILINRERGHQIALEFDEPSNQAKNIPTRLMLYLRFRFWPKGKTAQRKMKCLEVKRVSLIEKLLLCIAMSTHHAQCSVLRTLMKTMIQQNAGMANGACITVEWFKHDHHSSLTFSRWCDHCFTCRSPEHFLSPRRTSSFQDL